MALQDSRIDETERGRRRFGRWYVRDIVKCKRHDFWHEDVRRWGKIDQRNIVAVIKQAIERLTTQSYPKGGEGGLNRLVNNISALICQILLDGGQRLRICGSHIDRKQQ